MEVMYLLIAFSLLIASGFLLAFMWAVRSGQYDDRYTPSVRMLLDDIRPASFPSPKKGGDAAASRNESVDGVGHGKQLYVSGTRIVGVEEAGIKKRSTRKETEPKNRSGETDGSRKSKFDGRRGSNQGGGSPAAGICPQEHHLKPKTHR